MNFIKNSTLWLFCNLNAIFPYFSKGSDDVILCLHVNNVFKVEHSYNQFEPELLVATNPSIGLQNSVVSIVDNKFTCSIVRQNFVPNVANYFNLARGSSYYILVAQGPIING